MRHSFLALAMLTLAGPARAEPFQGTAVFHATLDGKTMQFRVAQLGSRFRQEISSDAGLMAVILYDSEKGEMTTLMPQQKRYMTMSVGDLSALAAAKSPDGGKASSSEPPITVTPTGEHARVAGIACDGYVLKGPSATVDLCAAKGMGTFGGMRGQPGSTASAFSVFDTKNPGLAKLAKDGFFPLKMTVHGTDGKTMTWEATSVDRTRPEASLFTPPSDYSAIDVRSMMPPH